MSQGKKKKFKNYRVEFMVCVPEDIPECYVKEWARYAIGDSGTMASENPLCNTLFDPVFGTFKMEAVK